MGLTYICTDFGGGGEILYFRPVVISYLKIKQLKKKPENALINKSPNLKKYDKSYKNLVDSFIYIYM